MTHKSLLRGLALAWVALWPALTPAQVTYTENFTGGTTNNSWYFFNGACLTAGSVSGSTSPGQIPACTSIFNSYYKTKGDGSLVGGDSGTLPDDPTLGGALRFTNGHPYGYNQNGAIVSNFSFPTTNGLQITFVTETYRGDSGGGSVADGADGMSFFLQSVDNTGYPPADLGAFGGSLGYTCSNSNNDGTLRTTGPTTGQPRGYDGLIGGYLGLGIDEYGNFFNPGDNTSTGPGYQGNRIAVRGAGSTTWIALNAAYPTQYPSTLTYAQRASAVQQACKTGYVYDWSQVGAWNTSPIIYYLGNNVHWLNGVPTPNQPTPVVYQDANGNKIKLPNYSALYAVQGSNVYADRVLTGVKIANEQALYRGPGVEPGSVGATGAAYGVPITYNLTVTPAGLLSLSYSYNGGVFQPVIVGQDLTQTNGGLPAQVRFGFAGSTGGSTNIHEIMCFSAQPSQQTSVSAGVNQKQSAKVQQGSQVYFAYYNTNNWPGSLTSQYLITNPNDPNSLIINPVATWDASCVLTDIPAGQTCTPTGVAGPTSGQSSANRVILTWNGSQGVPFEWANLTTAQQQALDLNDPGAPGTLTSSRLNYLRGDRSNEVNSMGVGLYRARTSVLADIIDSSPTWVGPPNAGYSATWTDLYPNGGGTAAPTPPENGSSVQSYPAFTSAMQNRTNVVYAGANDGLMHGFRSGSFSTPTSYVSTYNDGKEVLAYMPGYTVNAINSFVANTGNNYSNPQYGHHFSVDETPGTGDLFYAGQWHTWLVGAMGPGGNAIFVLDVTNPGTGNTNNFSESLSSAQSTVIGEWSTTTTTNTAVTPATTTATTNITCVNVSNCGFNLGRTYGTPQVRRFHSGDWGLIIGNGYGSYGGNGTAQTTPKGDAGIYVVTVSHVDGTMKWYYLSTGAAGGNGISDPAGADIDGDHIVDYVYAGDLQGHMWRFDLTSADPTQWGASPPMLLFTTNNGQPITTKPIIVINNSGTVPRILVEFGTGQQTPISNSNPATYASAQQALYGIWDWNLSAWNSKSPFHFASVSNIPTTLTTSSLQQQVITASYNANLSANSTGAGSSYRTVSNYAVCYADTTGCSQYGWYLALPVGPAVAGNANSPSVAEQVLFSPALLSGVFVVNTTVPPTNTPTTCSQTNAQAWTMALDPATGGALTSSYFQYANGHYINVTTTQSGQTVSDQGVSGIANLGTGTPTEVVSNNQAYQINSPDTAADSTPPAGICPVGYSQCPVKHHHTNVSGKRVTWIERR